MRNELENRFVEQYAPLISDFTKDIEGIDTKGMPEPHIPLFGSEYYRSKYKIAFYGIETNWWYDLTHFISVAKEDPYQAARLRINDFQNMEFKNWRNNFHTSFWDFIFQFLSTLYKIDNWEKLLDGTHDDILQSFVWGNINSIERYSVSAEPNGVDESVYQKVKNASKRFDSESNILRTLKPDVLILLDWPEAEQWLNLSNKKNTLCLPFDDHLTYYYLKDTNTHVFRTSHPNWIARNSSFKEWIEKIIEKIKEYNVWSDLPDSSNDALSPEEYAMTNEDKNNIDYKRNYVASLAKFLVDNRTFMSGDELIEHFKRNDIGNIWGDSYQSNSRGIYKVISAIWSYYHDEEKDYQTAYNIARAFVKKNGEYAY